MTDQGQLAGRCILQVLPALDPGGAERGAVDVAAAVVRAGGTALVASAGGRLEEELASVGGESVRLPLDTKNPAVMAINVRRLRDVIRSRAVSLVHARSRAPAWSALGAARAAGTPFMTTFHAAYNFSNSVKKNYNAVMAKGDRIIAISEYIARHVREHYDVPDQRLRVIYRGIDLSRFDATAVSTQRIDALRTLYELSRRERVILLPGRLSRPKGHEILVRALARCRTRTAVALIVGPDRKQYGSEVETLAVQLGVADRVRIADVCPDVPAAYALAHVVVVASTQPEGFGRTAVEAAAMGRPVIATGIGALPELVVDGETGWLVPPGDPAALADALDRSLSLPPDAYQNMGEAAMVAARSRFGLERMTSATLEVYAELLGIPSGGTAACTPS